LVLPGRWQGHGLVDEHAIDPRSYGRLPQLDAVRAVPHFDVIHQRRA
jgi:hypothetical protein